MAGKVILVLDSGHGGLDSGAVGIVDGQTYKEKTLCWELCQLVVKAGQGNKDIQVLVVPHTPEMQYPKPDRFRKRVAWANDHQATLFLSIHWNSADSQQAHGTEAWYRAGDTQSIHLANDAIQSVRRVIQTQDRGIHPDSANHHGSLGILHGHNHRAALLEVCFISNPTDMRAYLSHKDDVAASILKMALAQ